MIATMVPGVLKQRYQSEEKEFPGVLKH